MPQMTDKMTDLQNPDLTERLACYIGAVRLREMGNVGDDFVQKKLEDLQVACRAADTLLAALADPEKMHEVVNAMHAKLTGEGKAPAVHHHGGRYVDCEDRNCPDLQLRS